MTQEQQYCHMMLRQLRESYERDAKPYVDRLVRIKSMDPNPRILINTAHTVITDPAKIRAAWESDTAIEGAPV